MRLAFMGSPGFAVPVLDALHDAGHDIAAVYAQPPRPAGRGKKPRPTAVQARAEALGLPVFTPLTLRDGAEQARFAALGLDAAVVAAYGLILPRAILDAPRLGCLNVHPSLLPRWRGAAPIPRAIMAGDATTGVCIMRMEAGLDTGPVLLREETPIGADETAGALHDRLSLRGAALMLRALAENPPAVEQSAEGVTYAAKIDKDEARIDWSHEAAALDAHIRGLSPAPGAWTMIGGERVKVLATDRPEAADALPGTLLDDRLLVACGAGALRLTRVQRSGRGAMDTDTFLLGFTAPQGTILV